MEKCGGVLRCLKACEDIAIFSLIAISFDYLNHKKQKTLPFLVSHIVIGSRSTAARMTNPKTFNASSLTYVNRELLNII